MPKFKQILVLSAVMLPLTAMAKPAVPVPQSSEAKSTTANQSVWGNMNNRKISKITQGRGQHWVGDGFPVNNMFAYDEKDVSPFLLLDYAKPITFEASDEPRGVGMHPHRGFETVTIVYDGELQHKDTAGNHGSIGPGDVQWMTAASGILHEEKHSDEFTRKGGRLEMVQLWVNLPAKDKMSAPHYQEIRNANIPTVTLANNMGTVRIIAGKFGDVRSNVKTFTPIQLFDIRANEGAEITIPVTRGYTAMLLVLDGKLNIDNQAINTGDLVKFDKNGDIVQLTATSNAKILFMGGDPINEPVVGKGPFVMNTDAEIKQAYADLKAGKLQK